MCRHRLRRLDGDDGLTLIELLVVLIIIGMLAAIAVPWYLGSRKGAWAASVKEDLQHLHQAALSASTLTGNDVTFVTPQMIRDEGFVSSPGNVLIACVGIDAGLGVKLALYGRNDDEKNVYRLYDVAGGQSAVRMNSVDGQSATLDWTACPDRADTPLWVDTWPIGTSQPTPGYDFRSPRPANPWGPPIVSNDPCHAGVLDDGTEKRIC